MPGVRRVAGRDSKTSAVRGGGRYILMTPAVTAAAGRTWIYFIMFGTDLDFQATCRKLNKEWNCNKYRSVQELRSFRKFGLSD